MSKQACIIFFTGCYILGIIGFLANNINIFSLILFVILIFLSSKKLIFDKFAISCLLIFLVGFLNIYSRITESDDLVPVSPQNDVTVVGQVVSIPTNSSDDFTKFALKVSKYNFYKGKVIPVKAKVLVTFFANKNIYQNIETGDVISLNGRLASPKKASNPSEFCYSSYLKFQNIHNRFYVNDGNFVLISKPQKGLYKYLSSMNRIRNKIVSIHSQNIHSPQLELLGGIVFGDDAVNPTLDMKTSFQNSGLTHIIAASGMNVTMIFGMFFFISQILKLNYRFSIFLGLLSVLCYTCMTGFGAPVLRATLMLSFILIGKLFDRKANALSLLFIVAFLMLLFSPTMVMNIGFQLSFLVTLGLLLVCPLILDKIKNKYTSFALSIIVVPVIAQIFAAPIQMFYFNSFSVYSIFANILVVPILSVVSYLGFISSIFALIKPISYHSVMCFDFVLNPFLTYIVNVADYFSKLPNSSIVVSSPTILQICLYFTVLLLLISVFYKTEYKKQISVILSVCVLIFALTYVPIKHSKNEVIFFDVENADSALIKTSTGKYILIDTGKLPYKKFSPLAERVLLKYFDDNNIKQLDMLILSHFDADHSGGAIHILKKIPVSKMVVRSLDDKSRLATDIFDVAKNLNVEILKPENNEIIFDDGLNKIYSIYSDNGDDNDRSMMNLFMDKDNVVMFAGDCGVNNFENLKQYLPKNVSVLKVAHHGAKDTVSMSYLKHINPEIAVISTGINVYGHPHIETINLLKQSNAKVFRTDVHNALKIVLSKDENLVYSYNNKRKRFERIENDK